ncbi:hypothetical protein [Vibrio aestuarianus]|uniref:Tyr recombinase domain-containing protein n=1 Tax=Vibrio aestuarianus TaxID=28171 RepID=A0A9X4EX68_9VIBR|nr:hypothetical protein [Vibrio aestuarianus]MDE1244014.1 hypothetical protein [Vibrio aestuarianus]
MKLADILPLSHIEQVGDSYADLIKENASKLEVNDQKLKLKGTKLHFFNEIEENITSKITDLSDIWMPGTAGYEHPVPLLLYPHHTQTILSSVEKYASNVTYSPSFITQAKSRLSNTLTFVEWALLNEHYKLNSISAKDIERFCSDISAGGIAGLLYLPQRLDHLWDTIYNQPSQINELVNSDGYGGVVTGFRELAIKKVLGTSCTASMIPNRYYRLFGDALVDYGISVDEKFFTRGTGDLRQPSAKTLNTLFCEWNDLSRMEHDDNLSFLPFKDPYKKSSQLGRPRSRTKNLNVEHVVSLLGEAHLWVFEASPLIIKAVREQAKLRYKRPTRNKNERYSREHITGKLSKGHLSSSKTLNKLEKALGENSSAVKGTHVFRRIYALIYYYQYEHSELLALTHQLGHVDPEHTFVYVTDPEARVVHEKLQHQLKTTKSDEVSSATLLREENKALNKIIQEVGIEKSAQDILSLLMGSEKMAGRYPSYLKRVFKVLRNSVKFNEKMMDEYQKNFSDLNLKDQSEVVANVLHEKGHRNKPKPHASCHRDPETKESHKDPCDPIHCRGCAYQEVKQTHLDIMKIDLIDLHNIETDRRNSPLERIRAAERARNLEKVIDQHKREMERTADIFSHMRES